MIILLHRELVISNFHFQQNRKDKIDEEYISDHSGGTKALWNLNLVRPWNDFADHY